MNEFYNSDHKAIVVIPTLNEGGNIAGIISEISEHPRISNILIVDDDSKDGTSEIVTDLARENRKVVLVQHPAPPSFAGSYLLGFEEAMGLGADRIIQMDADGSHPPRVLENILNELDSHDLVIASRYVPEGGVAGWSKLRLLISRLGNFYARSVLNTSIQDLTGGYNGWHTELLKQVVSEPCACHGYAFQIWLKYRASRLSQNIAEIPFIFEERRTGQPKFGPHIIWEALIQVWKIRK